MKMMFPIFKDRFRLKQDFYQSHGPDIPAGTVVALDRVRLNKTTTLQTMVQLKTIVSPDPQFSQRKYGGTADYGHVFRLTIGDLRELDVEIVEGMK